MNMNNELDMYNSIIDILLTSAVIASVITSIVNIIIALINNQRLRFIEKKRYINETVKYRYERLYDILLTWNQYETKYDTSSKDYSAIATERMFHSFFDSHRIFDIVSPLIDDKYKATVKELYQQGNKLLEELFRTEFRDDNLNEQLKALHNKQLQDFIDIAYKYTSEIEMIIHIQLEELLKKQT